ncbi:protein-L-isoaspartate(D-aspartate) O-methyltransferase [Streptomyces sp. G45]|uniref:protein-L-isoaspartate(D-aspartate) O-methyltransferase n=1 Tax=Streptomyces sp. G45 TaxID=3406627 RepID=UPI003C17739A
MASGALSSDWAPAFAAVDRARFLPERMWPFDLDAKRAVTVEKGQDPDAWYDYADRDWPIVTQWDDGRHSGEEPGTVPTSSSSMPSVVYRLLGDLDVSDGMTALDVGTGRGETAGLLSYRLGGGNVTTVEVDAAVSREARAGLAECGLYPTTVVGDGLSGRVPGGPYDRVLVTCGIRSFGGVLDAVKPGGLVVAPFGTHYTHADAVVRLTATGDGIASGRFTRPAEFMKARAQREPAIVHGDHVGSVHDGDKRAAAVGEELFTQGRFDVIHFAAGLRLRDVRLSVADKRGPSRPVWLYGLTDTSWACLWFTDGQRTVVWQAGPRRLWDEAEGAYTWWEENDRPGHDRFGLTVTPDGTRAWLDDPANSWPL